MAKKERIIRVDSLFSKALNDMKLERIKKDLDVKMKSDRRLTKAIRRHPSFEKMREDIINAELEDE